MSKYRAKFFVAAFFVLTGFQLSHAQLPNVCAAVASAKASHDEADETFWAFVSKRTDEQAAVADVREELSRAMRHEPARFGPYIASTCIYAHGAVVGLVTTVAQKPPVLYDVFSAFDNDMNSALTSAWQKCQENARGIGACKQLTSW